MLTSKALVVESESEPAPNFIRKRALQLTNANKVPARDPDPLPSQHLRCTATHVHTLHLQVMSIESAQVGGPCGCTHLEVVRGARPGRAQTAGSWLPAVSRVLLCDKTAGSLATRRLQERAGQPLSTQPTALQALPCLGTYQQAKAPLLSGYPLQLTAG